MQNELIRGRFIWHGLMREIRTICYAAPVPISAPDYPRASAKGLSSTFVADLGSRGHTYTSFASSIRKPVGSYNPQPIPERWLSGVLGSAKLACQEFSNRHAGTLDRVVQTKGSADHQDEIEGQLQAAILYVKQREKPFRSRMRDTEMDEINGVAASPSATKRRLGSSAAGHAEKEKLQITKAQTGRPPE